MSSSRLFILVPIGILILVGILVTFQAPSTTASPISQSRPTPTPCVTPETLAGITRTIGTGCSTLVSKAKVSLGGGGDDYLGVCYDNILVPSNTPVWGMYPTIGVIEIGKPHVLNDLILEQCNRFGLQQTEARFSLFGPQGQSLLSLMDRHFTYNFSESHARGNYLVRIEGNFGVIEKELRVTDYTGPRITFRHPGTNAVLKPDYSSPVEWSNGFKVEYEGFAPYSLVETTLYETRSNAPSHAGEANAIDSWTFQTNGQGQYSEILYFPSTTKVSNRVYLLVACHTNDCSMDFWGEEPYSPRGISVPHLAWERFWLKQYQREIPEPRAYNFRRCSSPCDDSSRHASDIVPEKTERIYVQWGYQDIPIGASYSRTWHVVGQGDWVRYECIWPGPEDGTERITLREPEGLYSGVWQVTIAVNGAEILRETVVVDGNWKYWDPAGTRQSCR